MKNINPYRVMDGKWGGFGPASWFAGVDPENPKNVFEMERNFDSENGVVHFKYFRVWDNGLGQWRDLTEDEKILFTIPDRKLTVQNFDKIFVPSFKNGITFPSITEAFKS